MAIKKTKRDEKRKLKEIGSLQRMGKALGFPKEDPIIDDTPDWKIDEAPQDYDDVSDAEISDQPTGGKFYGAGGAPKPVRGWRRID